jgi:serine/threonine protein kinase
MDKLIQRSPYPMIDYKGIQWGKIIGYGENSNVYEGIFDKQTYAYKQVMVHHEEDYDNILYELNLLRKLDSHKHFIQIHGLCYHGWNLYYMMDLGMNISKYIELNRYWTRCIKYKEGYIPQLDHNYIYYNEEEDMYWGYIMSEEHKKELIKMLIECIYQLHELHIIHSDIKLDNLIMNHGIIQCIDFEVSYDMGDHQSKYINMVHGTEGYMSPEQYRGILTYKSDVYSLGVSLIEIWGGAIWRGADGFKPCRNEVLQTLRKIEKNNKKLADLFRQCISLNSQKRCTMKTIKNKIDKII